MKRLLEMVKEAFADWSDDKAPRLGAALAYYTIFSLAPLLMIAISIAGFFFGEQAVQGRVVEQIEGVIGAQAAGMVQEMLASTHRSGGGILATITGFVALILGATGAFNELRSSLNTVWDVPEPPSRGILGAVRERLLSFVMVLVIGFLLLVSLALSAALSGLSDALGVSALAQVANVAVSFGVVTLLFAAIFKILPETDVEWRDVWFGAAVTAALFTVGKFAIGLYLGHSAVGSTYGAAGALVILLVWVYYAAQILFFGAELTQVYAARHGSRIGAAPKSERRRTDPARQGAGASLPAPEDAPARALRSPDTGIPLAPAIPPSLHAQPVHRRGGTAAFLVGTAIALGILGRRQHR